MHKNLLQPCPQLLKIGYSGKIRPKICKEHASNFPDLRCKPCSLLLVLKRRRGGQWHLGRMFSSQVSCLVGNKVFSGWETVWRNMQRLWGSSIHLCFRMVRPPTLLNAS